MEDQIEDMLKKITKMKNTDFDANLAQQCREIVSELTFRTDQVNQLKKELDEANSTIFGLRKQLEDSKSVLAETKLNFTFTKKIANSAEEKLREVQRSFIRMKVKDETRTFERENVEAKIQKLIQEKLLMERELDELKHKLQYHQNYQRELEDKASDHTFEIARIKEFMQKLEAEQTDLNAIGTNINILQEYLSINQALNDTIDKMQKRNIALEYEVTRAYAKADKIEELLKQNPFQDSIKSKLKMWEDRSKQQEQESLDKTKTIEHLTNSLDEEMQVNEKLMEQLKERNKKLEDMEQTLNQLKAIKPEVLSDTVELE